MPTKKLAELRAVLGANPPYVTTYNPGDGTRYRFANTNDDYFAVRPFFTARTFTEAYAFARGYRAAMDETGAND